MTLVTRGSVLITRLKSRALRRRLFELGRQFHRRRRRARVIRILKRHRGISSFVRARGVGTRTERTLNARACVAHAFGVWVTWFDLRTTLQLIIMIWQQHETRTFFMHWKVRIHVPS
jgi:hypothetical protein